MTIDVGGMTAGLDDLGKGPAVVFIHGFPFHRGMWAREAAAAAGAGWRALAYDLRGFGESGGGGEAVLLESYVDDLLGLLDALSISRAVLCGLSMGGYIALRFAEREPARVSGLVLCDTQSASDADAGRLGRAAAMKTAASDRKAFAEGLLGKLYAPGARNSAGDAVRAMILGAPLGAIRSALAAMAARTDTTPSLARIAVPTLVLVGADDPLTPPAVAKAMAARIPGARLAVIPGASHVSNLDNPEAFGRELAEFLAGLKAA